MKSYTNWLNEATYRDKTDLLNAYLKGKIKVAELGKLSQELFGVEVATKKELEMFLRNSFMQDIMADTHKIKKTQIVSKVKALLKTL